MKKIVAIIDHVYEDLELWYPKIRLEEEGWQVVIAAPRADKTYTGKHGYPALAAVAIEDVHEADYDALLLPGGFAPDQLRRDPHLLAQVRAFNQAGKLIAHICHAGWICISADILRGRNATSTVGIKDDMTNAGATWLDEAVVIDGNQISARTPKDLAVFAKAMVDYLKG